MYLSIEPSGRLKVYFYVRLCRDFMNKDNNKLKPVFQGSFNDVL